MVLYPSFFQKKVRFFNMRPKAASFALPFFKAQADFFFFNRSIKPEHIS